MEDKTVLFICVENAAWSLMAESMFNSTPPAGWRAISAGTQPASSANPQAGTMLKEIGLDLPAHAPQLLTGEMMASSRVKVMLGRPDSDSCPVRLRMLGLRYWPLPDPAQLDDDGSRQARDALRTRVEALRRELVLSDNRHADLAYHHRGGAPLHFASLETPAVEGESQHLRMRVCVEDLTSFDLVGRRGRPLGDVEVERRSWTPGPHHFSKSIRTTGGWGAA